MEEFNGERNENRFRHFVILAGGVLPVWQKVSALGEAAVHEEGCCPFVVFVVE